MIPDAVMLNALRNEMQRALSRAEPYKTYALTERSFMDSIAEYLGDNNPKDLQNLRKEFVTQFNKLPKNRRIIADSGDRQALFTTKEAADTFYRRVLRNVRVSKHDPVQREEYRESYLYNRDGSRISTYRALYPQNYNIRGSISELDKPYAHNPLAYDKLHQTASSLTHMENEELRDSSLVITRKSQNIVNMVGEIRKHMAGQEIEMSINVLHNKIVGEKIDIRSYLAKMEAQIADYTRENLVLTTKEYLSEALIDIVFKGVPPKTVKPKVNRTTASGKQIVEITKPKATITKARRLRVGNSQLDSAQVVSLVNRSITQFIRRYMGTEGALVWRTGRFANSVKATRSVLDSRTNALYVYTTYMYAPYATFGKGGAQYTPARDPQKLINRSVRAILKESFQANWRLYVRDAAT